jgi:transposase
VPKPFPPEFRRDVIAVARKGEASVAQVARDFGVSESCLQRWLKIADPDDGLTSPTSADRSGGGTDESAELREPSAMTPGSPRWPATWRGWARR